MFRQATQGGDTADLFSDTLSKLTQSGITASGVVEDGIEDDDDIEGEAVQAETREREQEHLVRANMGLGAAGKRNGRVFLVRPSEDVVNVILVAVKEGGPATVDGLGPGRDVVVRSRPLLDLPFDDEESAGARLNAEPRDRIKERDSTIRAWLATLGLAHDPLDLRKCAVRIETVSVEE